MLKIDFSFTFFLVFPSAFENYLLEFDLPNATTRLFPTKKATEVENRNNISTTYRVHGHRKKNIKHHCKIYTFIALLRI